MIKKHSLPSETEFFSNKEGDINPPPKETKNRTKCPNKMGLPDDQLPSYTTPSSTIKTIGIKRSPPKTIFWSQTSPKTRRFFFQGFQTSPDQEGLTFVWLQTSPRDDSPRSQTSPQKSLSRLDVSKKNLNFFCDKNLKNMKIVPHRAFVDAL